MSDEIGYWDKPHKFEPKVFQGQEQLACKVCGRLEQADLHHTIPVTDTRSHEQVVKEKWPEACAVHFIGGWMIRLYSPPVPRPLSGFHNTELGAWHDAAERIRKENQK